ncbi:MAG: YdcF family protein [Chlorobiaceae bacterium]|nr:YdcF family protein [Chlorobiaceae bacterium]
MKAFIRIFLLFVVITCALSATIYLGLGALVSLHSSKPEKADVIVILGGDGGLRVKKGAELYNGGYAKNILLTGIDSRYYRPTHPNWRERKLMTLGVPKSAIDVDTWSETTWEEAENTAETMDRNGWKKAIIVSDPPHMLRLHRTWKKAFADSPKRFTLVATNPEWWNPLIWWENSTSLRFVLSEIKKNLFYSILYY